MPLNFLMLADLEEHTAASLPAGQLGQLGGLRGDVTSASSAAWANRARAQQASRFSYLQQSARLLHSRANLRCPTDHPTPNLT
jgi:hypothetical protein